MEHFCRYVIHFPKDQDDTMERCGRPASIKYRGMYFCADHYDQITSRVGFIIGTNVPIDDID